MSTIKLLASSTHNLMSLTTKMKNEEISKEDFNKKMILSMAYMLQNIENIKNDHAIDFYFPMSKLSYSYESNLLNLNQDANDESGNEVQCFEVPILSSNSTKSDSFYELWNDDNTFFSPVLSSDILLDFSGEDDLKSSNKKIETSFYSDESSRIISNRASSAIYSPLSSVYFSRSSCLHKKSHPLKESKKKMILNEFSFFLPEKVILFYIDEMNENYLRYMLFHYMQIKSEADKAEFYQQKMFLNLMKEFLLRVGISDKKIYEDALRSLIYQKDNYDFEIFLSCFHKILRLQDDYSIIKYKFLLYVTRMNKETKLTILHIKKYIELIQCKRIYDEETFEELKDNLIEKYKAIYPGGNGIQFDLGNLMLVLESFFESR